MHATVLPTELIKNVSGWDCCFGTCNKEWTDWEQKRMTMPLSILYIYIQMTTPFVNSVHTNDYALVNSVHTNDYALVSSVHTNDYAFVNSVHTNDYAFVNSVHTNDYALVSSVHTNDYAFVNSVHTTIFLILVLHNNTVQSIPQRSRYWHPREVRMKGTQEKKENTKFKMVSEREDKET